MGECTHVMELGSEIAYKMRIMPNGNHIGVICQKHQCVRCGYIEWRAIPEIFEEVIYNN